MNSPEYYKGKTHFERTYPFEIKNQRSIKETAGAYLEAMKIGPSSIAFGRKELLELQQSKDAVEVTRKSMEMMSLAHEAIREIIDKESSFGDMLDDPLFKNIVSFVTNSPENVVSSNVEKLIIQGYSADNALAITQQVISGMRTNCANLLFVTALFDKHGKRTYDVSPDLAVKLRHTELRGLKSDHLRLPFRSVYIVVPKAAGLRVWNQETDWHDVEGIYLCEEMNRGQRAWRFLICGEPKPVTVGGCNKAWVDNDALTFFHVGLPEDTTLDDCLATENEAILKARDSMGQMVDHWMPIFRWAMNVIVYATWPDADSEYVWMNKEAKKLWDRALKKTDRKKRACLMSKVNSMDQRQRIALGRSVVINRKDQLLTKLASGSTEGSEISVRVVVAGHWKRQAHGKGRELRKWIHIAPYVRGEGEDTFSRHVLR